MYTEVSRHANYNGTSVKVVWWSISEKTRFGIKHHFPFYLEEQTKCILRFPGMLITMVQVSKLYNDPFLKKKNTFWNKTSLSFLFGGTNSADPEVFRCVNCNGPSFKAVWWSVSDKTHFGIKHHFPLYLEGQTKCILRFPGMLITMVQVSKLYNYPFLRKHILE